MFTPYINKFFETINSKGCYVLTGSILLLSIMTTVSMDDPFVLKRGYSAAWLIMLYLFGAVIKRIEYDLKIKQRWLIICIFILVAFTYVSRYFIDIITMNIFGKSMLNDIFIQYTSPTILLAAVAWMLFGLNMKFRWNFLPLRFLGAGWTELWGLVGWVGGGGIIGTVSPLTFAVYIIHENPIVNKNLMRGSTLFLLNYSSPLIVLGGVLIMAFAIYLASIALEYGRTQLFGALHIDSVIFNAGNYIDEKLQTSMFRNI